MRLKDVTAVRLSSGYCVYSLQCPDTGEIRYIGRSSSGLKRPKQHWRSNRELKKRDRVHTWIRSLLRQKKCPVIGLLEVFQPSPDISKRLDMSERFWIRHFQLLGADLTNQWKADIFSESPTLRHSGWKHSKKTRQMMSKKLKGRKVGAYWRRALRQAQRPDRKAVICANDGRYFNSISSASRTCKVPASHISAICNGYGKLRSTHGLRFVFENALDRVT